MSLTELKKEIIKLKRETNDGVAIGNLHICLELIELEEKKIQQRMKEFEKDKENFLKENDGRFSVGYTVRCKKLEELDWVLGEKEEVKK